MNNVWFSTDWHLWNRENNYSHPYRSISNLGRLSDNFARDIQVDDLFIHLGDLCDPEVADPKKLKTIIATIPCYKVLCKGNHDTQDDAFYLEMGFDVVCDVCTFFNIACSHKPMKVPPDWINIHGHLHTEKMSTLGSNHINAFGSNFQDRPTLIEDLLEKAPYQKPEEYASTNLAHVEEKFEKYMSLDNEVYSNIVDLTDHIKLVPVDEAAGNTFDLIEVSEIQTPDKLNRWMKKTIKYSNFTRLKNQAEVIKTKSGSCHDQVAFAYPYLKKMDVEPRVLFFIAYQEGNPNGGMTHSLIYWEDSDKLYWFENAWSGMQGIHTFNNLDELKEKIEKLYERMPASKKFPSLEFRKTSIRHFKPGCTLGELVEDVLGKDGLDESWNTTYGETEDKLPIYFGEDIPNQQFIIDRVTEFAELIQSPIEEIKVMFVDAHNFYNVHTDNQYIFGTYDPAGDYVILVKPDQVPPEINYSCLTIHECCHAVLHHVNPDIDEDIAEGLCISWAYDHYEQLVNLGRRLDDPQYYLDYDVMVHAIRGLKDIHGDVVYYWFSHDMNPSRPMLQETAINRIPDSPLVEILFQDINDTEHFLADDDSDGNHVEDQEVIAEASTYYRYTYDGQGIYDALRQNVSADEWKHMKTSDAFTWLPVPDVYDKDTAHTSFFTDKGNRWFLKRTMPLMHKHLDKSKIKLDKITIKDSDDIVYSDKYQTVIPTGSLNSCTEIVNETATFNDVKRIVDNIPKEEHHFFYHGNTFKNSPNVVYRDVAYVHHVRGKVGAFIEVYVFDDAPDTGIVVIAAEPAARGKGLTDKLVNNAIKALSAKGIHTLYWRCDADNTASYKLAERNGFTLNDQKTTKDQYVFTRIIDQGDIPAELKVTAEYMTNPSDDNAQAVRLKFYDDETYVGEVCVSSIDSGNGFIYDLEVTKSQRRKGYGRHIMQYVLDHYDIKDLTVDLDNTVAIKLYESMGFKIKKKWKDPTSNKMVYWMLYKPTKNKAYMTEATVSDYHEQDRASRRQSMEKYGLKTPGQSHEYTYDEKPESDAERRTRERREKRVKSLKKARHAKKRKAFIRKVKSKLPGVKNENESVSDAFEYEHSELWGDQARWFEDPDRYAELYESAFDVGPRRFDEAIFKGQLDEYESWMISEIHKASYKRCISEIIRIENFRDEHMQRWITNLNAAAGKGEFTNPVGPKYRQQLETAVKLGSTSERVKKHINWLKSTYISAAKSRRNELEREGLTETNNFKLMDNVKFMDRLDESAADDKLYPAYVMLMHSGTALATAIKTITQSNFSHSSISFDSSMHNMYSFGRKSDMNPFIGTFKKEDIRDDFYQGKTIPYALYVVPCTRSEILAMKKRLDYFIRNKSKFKYDFVGLFKNYFGIADNPEYKWFCSRFVADILNAGRPSNDPYVIEPSLMKPEDFTSTTFATYVTGGMLAAYDSTLVDKRTKAILRIEQMNRAVEKQLLTQNESAIYDLDPFNPYQEATLNYQLTTMDEAAVADFFKYLKSFKVRFDPAGNIIITRREVDQLDQHFRQSIRMVKAYKKAGNIEGVKEELAKVNFMIEMINTYYLSPKVIQSNRVKADLKKEMMDLRSVMLNMFQQNLTWITTREPRFNFQTYYDGSKYGKETYVPKTVLSALGKMVVTALT